MTTLLTQNDARLLQVCADIELAHKRSGDAKEIRRLLAELAHTPAETLPGLKAKASIYLLIDTEELAESIATDADRLL